MDELALRRQVNARRLAGGRRRPPKPAPGDLGVMIEDLRQIQGMCEEVVAEARALGDDGLITATGALYLHVTDVVSTAVRAREGGET